MYKQKYTAYEQDYGRQSSKQHTSTETCETDTET